MNQSESSAEVVARITQRFCPRCRTALTPDSPEGLCPTCLLAGGLASAAAVESANGSAITTPPSGSQPPATGEWTDLAQHFPQLEILELLGRGGMGAVYKARQKNLDRFVALKVIPPDAAQDPTFAERFAREARALARLNHPNIVTVYDFGQVGDVYYLLMEYVDGVNLRHAERAGRLDPREALSIVPPICDALQYAHDQGVVHRDIKPENVLLDRSGRVKIADFGLAKMLGKGPDDFTLTGTQQVMGTPRYMAPEQIERPSTVDHRADIYSLGVVLYEMLTGELPIGRFQPPSQKVQVDVRIDQVVLRTLEKEPERRYQQAGHVKTELATATGSSHPQAPSWHSPALPPRKDETAAEMPAWMNAWSIALAIVAGLFMLIGGTAGILWAVLSLPSSSGSFRECVAVAFLFVIGGVGTVVGGYFGYRGVAGGDDLWLSRRPTWLDFVMWMFLVSGIIWLVLAAIKLLGDEAKPDWALISVGCVTIFYGAAFLLPRMSIRAAGTGAPPISLEALTTAANTTGAMLRGVSRSRHDVWLGGVCGGLGENTPIPTWCWRALFIVLIFGYGVGGVAYIVMWICLPEGKGEPVLQPNIGPVSAWLRRMARSQADAMVGGVCGGLGENTPLPSWCWRLLFAVLTLAYGIGVLPYLVLWICLPEARSEDAAKSPDTAAPADDRPAWQPPMPATKAGSNQVASTAIFLLLAMVLGGVLFFYWMVRGHTALTATATEEILSAEVDGSAVSKPDFDRMLKSLRSESFDPGKVSFIKMVGPTNTFTSEQVRRLLKEFSFDPGREEAAMILHPRVIDTKNLYRVLEAFDFDPTKTSVRERLELDREPKSLAEQPGDSVSHQELDDLLRRLKQQSQDSGKLKFIRAISHGRAFTSEQVSQLLNEFSFDPDREQAAVAIYPRLTDPQNFYRVLDVFTFDPGRQNVRKRLKLD